MLVEKFVIGNILRTRQELRNLYKTCAVKNHGKTALLLIDKQTGIKFVVHSKVVGKGQRTI